MKLQAYVTLQILCNPSIQNKIRQEVYEMSKYENCVLLYSLHSFYCKASCIQAKRHKYYFNVFSPSTTETITPEKDFVFQNYMTNVKIDEICQELSTSHFVTQLAKLELVFL